MRYLGIARKSDIPVKRLKDIAKRLKLTVEKRKKSEVIVSVGKILFEDEFVKKLDDSKPITYDNLFINKTF